MPLHRCLHGAMNAFASIAICLCVTKSVSAQSTDKDFIMPLTLSDGGIMGTDLADPFTASARLSPMIGLDDKNLNRFGATACLLFVNPQWSIMAGPRLQTQIYQYNMNVFPVLRIHAGVEALWGTQNRMMVGGDVLLDLSLIQFHAMFDYDLKNKESLPGFGIGVELLRWFAPESNNDLRITDQPLPQTPTYLDTVAIRIRSYALQYMDDPSRVRMLEVFLQQPGVEYITVAALKAAMDKQHLTDFASRIDDALKGVATAHHSERETVAGLMKGWEDAIALAKKS